MPNPNITKVNKLQIKKFRALNDINIELGEHLTLICGKNGTSKSSILGITAQIFSFDKDYVSSEKIQFETIVKDNFKSDYREHFRFSNKYDVSGSLEVDFEIYDAYTKSVQAAELRMVTRSMGETKDEDGNSVPAETSQRTVVRKNNSIPKLRNTSRNFTHPVVYLSLERLLPIPKRGNYKPVNFEYLDKVKDEFIKLNNRILNKTSDKSTGTSGSVKSAVVHSDSYDQDSVSSGEDNTGKIISSLLSFKKLKEEYKDYHGGVLLIDEADAALFPAAQIELIDVLAEYCKQLDIQVIITSHSPTMIEHVHKLSQQYRRKFKTIYLSDSYGKVAKMDDVSWTDIQADLLTKTIKISNDLSLPKVNTYFEDKEAFDYFNAILYRHKTKKILNQFPEISMGCTNYIQLVQKGVPEFSTKSLIVLDGDVKNVQEIKTIVSLPGHLPPDQLIFEFLYNLEADNAFWKNDIKFNKKVFQRISNSIISRFDLKEAPIDLKALIQAKNEGLNAKEKDQTQKKDRELFKSFYKAEEFQNLLQIKKRDFNPWVNYIKSNRQAVSEFMETYIEKLFYILHNSHGVDKSINIDSI
ncbi:AAA family ATPase [Comamonas testosteroni]|uniref:AAA family ATPase n=1 Tax=Comamonas testosteroni TaxID=285 RepID=UPI0009BBE220|nr:AAA family ATPase [Comamonas testosteroni]